MSINTYVNTLNGFCLHSVSKCGMNFEWNLFEFTKNDCLNLAKFVKGCGHLKVLRVRRSKIMDERARLLISYLLDHPALQTLGKTYQLQVHIMYMYLFMFSIRFVP